MNANDTEKKKKEAAELKALAAKGEFLCRWKLERASGTCGGVVLA